MSDPIVPLDVELIASRLTKHIMPHTVTSLGEVTLPERHRWNDGAYRQFQMGYGLRKWTQFKHSLDNLKVSPVGYKAALENIASDAHAMELRDQLAVFYTAQTGCDLAEVKKALDYLIIVDGADVTLALRLYESEGPNLIYLVIDDRLVHSSNIGNHYDTNPFRSRILSTLSSSYPSLNLLDQTRLLFATPHQNAEEAKDYIGKALLHIGERLSHAGTRVAIASSDNRFNDAAGDTDWMAVNVDGVSWDNGAYFQHTVDKLSDLPLAIDTAVGILALTQKIGLRDMLQDYLGDLVSSSNDVLILSVDERGMHVCFAPSNWSGGPVYIVDSSGLPKIVGRAMENLDCRMEWGSNGGEPVVTYTPRDEFFATLKGKRGSTEFTYFN